MLKILLGWAINAAAIFLLPYILPSVQLRSFAVALLVALVIGLLNTFIRPVLFLLTLPITVITLGLFTLVLNGLMFWLAARFIDGFEVEGFWWAVLAAIVYSIVSWAISTLIMAESKPRKA